MKELDLMSDDPLEILRLWHRWRKLNLRSRIFLSAARAPPHPAAMVDAIAEARQQRRPALLFYMCIWAAMAFSSVAPAQDRADREFRECPQCPQMMAIPAGSFLMGSPRNEAGRFDAEGPQHPVQVKAFALGKFDVTNAEFLVFLRETGYQPPPCDRILGQSWSSPGRGLAYPPGEIASPRQPAVCLSWRDAEAYIAWLNRGLRARNAAPGAAARGPYRLPSEAEWEYAARAGTATARWWGDAIGAGNANCNGCGSRWDGREIADIGSFRPNPFGLSEMLGNVWQWTADCWNENYVGAPRDGTAWTAGDCTKHVIRGGSWANPPVFIRAAARSHAAGDGSDFDYSNYTGFRIARDLP